MLKIPNTINKLAVAAIIGRTAVGKSTIINALIGEDLCIVSNRTQTTRHLIRAITLFKDCQIVLTDTPGYQERPQNALNKAMNRSLSVALTTPNIIIWVLDCEKFLKNPTSEMRFLEKLFAPNISIIKNVKSAIVLNKIDRLRSPNEVLKAIEFLAKQYPQSELIPVSAKTKKNLNELLEVILSAGVESPPLFPIDEISDLSEKFFAAEFLRESIYAETYQELPFSCAVTVDEFNEVPAKEIPQLSSAKVKHQQPRKKPLMLNIALTIHISDDKHKPIVLGEHGSRLKSIATNARLKMEDFFGRKVYLQTWVKINENWQDNPQLLKEFGYL